MKQFEFRLQKVMETTNTRQELQKRELALALTDLSSKEDFLEKMLLKLESQIDQFSGRKKERSMTAAEMLNFSAYTEKMVSEVRQQEVLIVQVTEMVRQQREKLLEISKDKKVLERLKERKYEEYRKKLRKMEQKFMDEISVRNLRDDKAGDRQAI